MFQALDDVVDDLHKLRRGRRCCLAAKRAIRIAGWVCEGHQRRHQGPGTRLDHIDNKHLPGIPQDLERVSIILTINIYLYTTCLYDPEYNLRLEGDMII